MPTVSGVSVMTRYAASAGRAHTQAATTSTSKATSTAGGLERAQPRLCPHAAASDGHGQPAADRLPQASTRRGTAWPGWEPARTEPDRRHAEAATVSPWSAAGDRLAGSAASMA